MSKYIGDVSAYAYAVSKGYTGTEEEFAELMASYADVGQTAVNAKDAAVAAKTAAQTAATTATNKASEATTAAQTATTKAGEASQSASQAQASAQTASTKASEASASASTASAKATEATTAAGTATTAKNDAVSAKNAAETAQSAAETAQGKAEDAQAAAEDAAESVSASAAQIATNTSDISELKEDLEQLDTLWGSIENIGFIDKPQGMNYIQKYSEDITSGIFWYPGSDEFQSNATMSFGYMPVLPDKTYSLLGEVQFLGTTNVVKIPIFDSEKTFLSYKWGTLDSDTGIVTVTGLNTILTAGGYAGYSFKTDNKKSFFVEGEKTDLSLIEYYLNSNVVPLANNKTENPLYRKTAVFLGDSICAADAVPSSETDFYKWGWAGRIGNANDMIWENYGVAGGSITRITGRSCIQDRLVIAYAAHPDADFFIFEGGTNDADAISGSQDYSKGTFADNDFSGTYDTTTFCGSLETFIYNIIDKYPDKKIGYIIPLKMGKDINAFLNRRSYFDTAKAICKKWGIPVIDVWEESALNPQLLAYYDKNKTDSENITDGSAYIDGQHPTDRGYDIMTPVIEKWMQNI